MGRAGIGFFTLLNEETRSAIQLEDRLIQDQFLRESLLRLLDESLSSAGADAQMLLVRYGLDCNALDTWSAFSLTGSLNHIWADAEAATNNPAVGLCVPRESGYGLGVVTQLVQSASTVRVALQAIARHARLVCPTLSLNIVSAGNQCSIELILARGAAEATPHHADFLALLLVQHIRVLTGCPFRLQQYSRLGSPPLDLSPWEEAFACPVHFGADHYIVTVAEDELDYRLPSANQSLYHFCDRLVSRGSEGGTQPMTCLVRRCLEELVTKGEPRREEVASQLCMSARSLSRRLASEGSSFLALVDEVRRELAVQYLKNDEFNLSEITYELGFGDPSNFYRACKRWFGETPQVVRQQSCESLAIPTLVGLQQ